MKRAFALLAASLAAGLSGCAVVPVAEQPVYVAPAPAMVVVRPAYRPYYYGGHYHRHHRHWR